MKRKRSPVKGQRKADPNVYKVKYIGETGRSAYERSIEHVNDYDRLEERSHLLRHYVLKHQDIRLDELEFGMRVRSSFKTAIERQVGEAIAISREKRAGTNLLNSKAEFNRCKIERLDTRSEKEKLKEMSADNEVENKLKEIIKCMQTKKRERSKENRKRTRDIRAACMEIISENKLKWKKRRKEQELVRRENDEHEKESLERMNRRNVGTFKKKIFIESLKRKDSNTYREWIKEKQGHWRNYRENREIPPTDGDTTEISCLNVVTGNGETDIVESISEIGRKVQLKLKETVFKRNFSDLKRSEYLRPTNETINYELNSRLSSNSWFEVSDSDSVNLSSDLSLVNFDPIKISPLSYLIDSELDLLRLMSTWPDLFRLSTSNNEIYSAKSTTSK